MKLHRMHPERRRDLGYLSIIIGLLGLLIGALFR
jgi:hypothetical protein